MQEIIHWLAVNYQFVILAILAVFPVMIAYKQWESASITYLKPMDIRNVDFFDKITIHNYGPNLAINPKIRLYSNSKNSALNIVYIRPCSLRENKVVSANNECELKLATGTINITFPIIISWECINKFRQKSTWIVEYRDEYYKFRNANLPDLISASTKRMVNCVHQYFASLKGMRLQRQTKSIEWSIFCLFINRKKILLSELAALLPEWDNEAIQKRIRIMAKRHLLHITKANVKLTSYGKIKLSRVKKVEVLRRGESDTLF